MSIGKMIAHALHEAMEQSKHVGPEIKMNAAALAAHKEHKDIIDRIYPDFQAAELAMTKAKNRLEEERLRWALAMRIAQPETAEGEGFSINDAGTHFQVQYASKEECEAANGPEQPEWVRDLLRTEKPN